MAAAPALDLTWRSALLLVATAPGLAAGLALALRDVERRAGVFLFALVCTAAVSITPQIIGFSGFYDRWPDLSFAPFSAELYVPAFFYAHTSQLIRGRVERLWLWLLPGVLQTTYYSVAFVAFEDVAAKWAYNNAVHDPFVYPLEVVMALAMTVLALGGSRRLLRRYQAYLDATESVDGLFDPRWIRSSIWLLLITSALWLGLSVTSLVTEVSYVSAYPIHVAVMTTLSALCVAALAGVREPFPTLGQVPLHVPDLLPRAADEDTESESTDIAEPAPAVDATNWSELGSEVEERIRDDAWFTEPRLSIRDVARRLGTNESYVSRALNDGLGTSFKACVHGMRVAEAQRLLRETTESVLAVGLAAGFSSKSTFNRVFRDRTGLTPTAYRTSQNPDSGSQSVN